MRQIRFLCTNGCIGQRKKNPIYLHIKNYSTNMIIQYTQVF